MKRSLGNVPALPPDISVAIVETYSYQSGADLIDGVTILSDYVETAVGQGATTQEIAQVLNTTQNATNNGTIATFKNGILKGNGPTYQQMYASDLWRYLDLTAEAGGITLLGAAAKTAFPEAYGVLFGDPALAGTLAGTGGLLTMSVPTVASVAAPLLGVSLGNVLYESNPELWTKISQALIPWAWELADTIAGVVDENGDVYIPKEAVDALKNLFDEEGIGTGEEYVDYSDVDTSQVGGFEYTGDLFVKDSVTLAYEYPPGSGQRTYYYSATGESEVIFLTGTSTTLNQNGDQYVNAYSESPFVLHGSQYGDITSRAVTSYGITYYVASDASLGGRYPYFKYSPSISYVGGMPIDSWQTAYLIFQGDIINPSFPEGTSEWQGTSVDYTQLPIKKVVTDVSTGATKDYVKATLPVGSKTESNDPNVEPDPTATITDPSRLNDYIAPFLGKDNWPANATVAPQDMIAPQSYSDILYVPQPDLNPQENPAEPPEHEPSGGGGEGIPQSGGLSPDIIFPIPGTAWPSIVPSSGPGLVHVYNPTPAQFIAFGNWLWVTYADVTIQKLWNNPFDGVISAHELYATPSKDGTDTIRSGFLDSGVQSTIVRQRYTSINCGSILVPEYYGNYLDYSPYSKAYIYLPFIGIVEVEVDDIVGHAVNVTYHIDSYNGSCIAQVTVAKDNYLNTLYQFSGNCSVDIPLTGGSQAAIKAGIISAAAYGIGSTLNGIINGGSFGGLKGGLGSGKGALVGGATGAISGVAAGIANAVSQKSSVQHSGSFGASYGAMGIKKPYIIVRRPVQKQVPSYQNDYGFPAHKRVIVGQCTGFLRVREVNVQSTLATDEEKLLIEEMLKTGVYID